jgi:hypothetical protein
MTVSNPLATHQALSYRIDLEASDTQLLQDALDLYSRIGLGQFGVITELARFGQLKNLAGNEPSDEDIKGAEGYLDGAKNILMDLAPNASHGIYGPHVAERFKKAWSLQKAIRHRLAWDRSPGGGMGVSFDKPVKGLDAPTSAKVHSQADPIPAAAVDASSLPAGCFLGQQSGQWVVGLLRDNGTLEVFSRSASPQTAVSQATALVQGRYGLSTSY